MPSGFTKKSDRQLRQADYNRLQPHIHRMVKLSYIWPFGDYWSYIVHRAKLSYKYDNYHTPGNTANPAVFAFSRPLPPAAKFIPPAHATLYFEALPEKDVTLTTYSVNNWQCDCLEKCDMINDRLIKECYWKEKGCCTRLLGDINFEFMLTDWRSGYST